MSTPPHIPRPDDNPYAPPAAPILGPIVPADGDLARAEAIRREHLSTEANIRSVGQLIYLGCFAVAFLVIYMLASSAGALNTPILFGVALGLAGLGLFYGFLGYGLTHFLNWARWAMVVLIGLSLASQFPRIVLFLAAGRVRGGDIAGVALSFAISGYILYLLLGRQASVIFTPEYRAIRACTPHVKSKTGCVVKGIIGLFLGLVVALVIASFVGYVFTRR